jgi:putative transposase
MKQTVAIDFFVVPTIRFRMLWTLVVLSHDRRKILHTATTHRPSGAWTVQQLRNIFSYEDFPKYVLHDRDHNFVGLSKLGIEEVITSFRSPWQNAFVERVIGSIRRECTNHLVVFNEKHLEKILSKYRDYYNGSRTHLSLNKDSPDTREVISAGRIKVIPKVNGLHHEFSRTAPEKEARCA